MGGRSGCGILTTTCQSTAFRLSFEILGLSPRISTKIIKIIIYSHVAELILKLWTVILILYSACHLFWEIRGVKEGIKPVKDKSRVEKGMREHFLISLILLFSSLPQRFFLHRLLPHHHIFLFYNENSKNSIHHFCIYLYFLSIECGSCHLHFLIFKN